MIKQESKLSENWRCDKHILEWDIYWITCFIFLWIECYISAEHGNHRLIKKENAFEELQAIAIKELSNENLAVKKK